MKRHWLTIPALCMVGCTNAPSPASTQATVQQVRTPEEQCESRSRVNMSDSSQGAALVRAALYDDCLIPFKNDAQEITKLRRLGQIEALKGYISLGAGNSPNTELVKTKLLASADL